MSGSVAPEALSDSGQEEPFTIASDFVLVKAPIAKVWRVLTGFAVYGAWNPLCHSISVDPNIGGKVEMQVKYHCAVTLLDAEPAADGSIGGRTPFIAYHFARGRGEPLVIGDEYEDVFRPTASGWRIAKRTSHARWQVDDPAMLASLME